MESEKRPEICLQLYRYIISSVGIRDRTREGHATHLVALSSAPLARSLFFTPSGVL
jgi:hypothetical protein